MERSALTFFLLYLSLLLPLVAEARTQRSAAELLAFKRHNPCPSTGERRGNCPGYVIDHIQPLCAGGADNHQTNMQWQTVEDAKAKDVVERHMCRSQKGQGNG